MKKTTGNKFNVYQAVTDKVIEALEKGVAPWSRPWKTIQSGEYRNAVTGRHYRGMNVLLLNISSMINGYTDPRWLTYKNAEAKGGNVKKGEKGTQVIFWQFFNKEDTKKDGITKNKSIPFARAYTVFNVAQCENLNLPELEVKEEIEDTDINEIISQFMTLPDLIHGGNKACYSPSFDRITMPEKVNFNTTDHYHSTFCHELVHWTGNVKRLDRDLKNRFGSEAYAFEELVAEMGSAFLGSFAGIPFDGMQHPEYIASWLKRLKEDNKAIFTASSKAQEASDWILKASGYVKDEEIQEEAIAA